MILLQKRSTNWEAAISTSECSMSVADGTIISRLRVLVRMDGGARALLPTVRASPPQAAKKLAPARMSGGHPFSIQPVREAFTSRRKRGP